MLPVRPSPDRPIRAARASDPLTALAGVDEATADQLRVEAGVDSVATFVRGALTVPGVMPSARVPTAAQAVCAATLSPADLRVPDAASARLQQLWTAFGGRRLGPNGFESASAARTTRYRTHGDWLVAGRPVHSRPSSPDPWTEWPRAAALRAGPTLQVERDAIPTVRVESAGASAATLVPAVDLDALSWLVLDRPFDGPASDTPLRPSMRLLDGGPLAVVAPDAADGWTLFAPLADAAREQSSGHEWLLDGPRPERFALDADALLSNVR
ncbi:hypothetical protein [Halomarina ordinaria]|uniref:Uncharacterized protein n=1 Tax=Halomarina ordinaria TaxID=3033939 RepID=A0ABD5UCS9_9EURY|nr:hypothetical protein [Halomarina sp. PSRA2]